MPWTFWAGYLEKLGILALVLLALYFVASRLRDTRFFARSGRSLTLLESMMLSQHAALYIVRVGSRYFLIGGTPGGICALAELTESDAATPRR